MKKLVIILLALLIFSGLAAVELQYWGAITHFTRVPWTFVQSEVTYTYSTIGTNFAPVGECDLNGMYFMVYGGGQVGDLSVQCEVWAVDEATHLPTGMFPLVSVTIPYAELTLYPNFHYLDLSSYNLTFPTGQEFFFAFSAPLGIAGSTYTCPMLDAGVVGHSYRYFTQGLAGWQLYSGEYTHTADLTYTGAFMDLEATSLWFTGDFFLEQGDQIAYEADVINNSDAIISPVTADVYLEVYNATTWGDPLWSSVLTNQVFNFGESRHFVFAPYTYTAQGEYCVVLRTALAGDMVATNDAIYLEQQVVVLPDQLDYDDGTGETAHAFYDAGTGWANSFWYSQPMKITSVGFSMRDATWPAGAQPFLQYKIYGDDGAGAPGAMLYDSGIVGCTLGAWNDYDVSAQNLMFAAYETFYVAYHQVGDYELGAPGLLGDGNLPFTGWLTSWVYYEDVDLGWIWETPNATDEDMMIRCNTEFAVMGVEAPIISILMDSGYPTITWDEVLGAQSYNLYGSNDPEAVTPWTPIETGIGDLGYAYMGTEAYKFFYVTASTEPDGSKKAPIVQNISSKPFNPIAVRSDSRSIKDKLTISEKLD